MLFKERVSNLKIDRIEKHDTNWFLIEFKLQNKFIDSHNYHVWVSRHYTIWIPIFLQEKN